MFIYFLYMFRATMCPSSRETTVFMWYLILVILYGWLSGMQEFHSTLRTRQSSIQSEKFQVSHRYSCLSWLWAHSRPKYVENRNKHTKKNCAPSWLYLQDYTGMHGQQNIKYSNAFSNFQCCIWKISQRWWSKGHKNARHNVTCK